MGWFGNDDNVRYGADTSIGYDPALAARINMFKDPGDPTRVWIDPYGVGSKVHNPGRLSRLDSEERKSPYPSLGRSQEQDELRDNQRLIDEATGNTWRLRDRKTRRELESLRRAIHNYNLKQDSIYDVVRRIQDQQGRYQQPSQVQTEFIDQQAQTYLPSTVRNRGVAGAVQR